MSISSTGNSASLPATSSATSSSSNSSSSTANAFGALGPDAFLKLLTTQLANQDPLNPMDDTQSVAQLATFSQLQASTNLETSFTSFNQNFGILQSAGLLGKTVTVNDTSTGGTTTGYVTNIGFSNGTPTFSMADQNGQALGNNYSLSSILSIT